MKVVVHAANINDSKGGRFVMDAAQTQFPNLRMLWVDQGYRGSYWKWLQLDRQVVVEIIAQRYRAYIQAHTRDVTANPLARWRFPPAPRRWVVERTLDPKGTPIGRYRRFRARL